ncbi:MAG: extracellular solute-binding protein, partial [Paucibacter sp.]|nr:extracellular solute-binding protein [Roseateles sp.]
MGAVLGGMVLGSLSAGAGDPAAITFRYHDSEAPEMQAALDDFQAANPDVHVTMQRLGWGEAQAQYLREAAVGEAPDVVELVYVWTRPFAAAGALAPLDADIAKTGAKSKIGLKGWDDFIARDLAVGPDGKTYAIPFTTDTLAIFYNKDLLHLAGYERPPNSWAGLRQASLDVFKKTGKAGWAFAAGTCATPSIWFYLNSFWWSKGHALIDQDASGKYYMHITPQQIAEGFDYFNQYLRAGDNPKSMTSVCLLGPQEIVEGVAEGNIAIV